ncbi:protein of unknown function (plasmid) [Rhodovastum atsumiense]|nr:protein of unknown function [Rhodovastum atsumiense]
MIAPVNRAGVLPRTRIPVAIESSETDDNAQQAQKSRLVLASGHLFATARLDRTLIMTQRVLRHVRTVARHPRQSRPRKPARDHP